MVIVKDILKEMTFCERNINCIRNGKHASCIIEMSINSKVHFVSCLNNDLCINKISFNSEFICVCQARKRIFGKSGKKTA